MPEPVSTFQCPSCGASLEPPAGAATMKCGYCGTSVVIPTEIRASTPSVSAAPQINFDFNTFLSKAIRMGAVVRLAHGGMIPEAVRLYQENTGASAEQAQQIVNAILESTQNPSAMSMNQAGTGELGQVVSALETRAEMRQQARQARRRARGGNCLGLVILLAIGLYFYLNANGMLPAVIHFLRSLLSK